MTLSRSKTELRWGAQSRINGGEDARDRLLDAAEACLSRYGLAKTTVEDVAREAKVSRRTFYRYFEGRSSLIAAMFLRESDEIWQRAEAMLQEQSLATPFAALTVELILFAVEEIRGAKYLPLLLNEDGTSFTAKALTASSAFYARGREVVGPFFERAKAEGQLRPEVDLDGYLEWHLRIVFSFVANDGPTQRSAEETRRFLTAFVSPPLAAGSGPERRVASRPKPRH